MPKLACARIALSALILAGPMSGTADAAERECPAREVCVYEHDRYGGCWYHTVMDESAHEDNYRATHWEDCGESDMNDKISSYVNNSFEPVLFFEHKGLRGFVFCAMPGASSNDLGNFENYNDWLPNPEDKFSSHNRGSRTTVKSECDYFDQD